MVDKESERMESDVGTPRLCFFESSRFNCESGKRVGRERGTKGFRLETG